MVIYAHHGAHEEERTMGQRFEIDVELGLDVRAAAREDKLDACVDYAKVYHNINEAVTEKRFYLIEAVAQHIADKVLLDFKVDEVTVRVRKPNVPIKGSIDHVEVEITRRRGNL